MLSFPMIRDFALLFSCHNFDIVLYEVTHIRCWYSQRSLLLWHTTYKNEVVQSQDKTRQNTTIEPSTALSALFCVHIGHGSSYGFRMQLHLLKDLLAVMYRIFSFICEQRKPISHITCALMPHTHTLLHAKGKTHDRAEVHGAKNERNKNQQK